MGERPQTAKTSFLSCAPKGTARISLVAVSETGPRTGPKDFDIATDALLPKFFKSIRNPNKLERISALSSFMVFVKLRPFAATLLSRRT
jgi:hypothetical protein